MKMPQGSRSQLPCKPLRISHEQALRNCICLESCPIVERLSATQSAVGCLTECHTWASSAEIAMAKVADVDWESLVRFDGIGTRGPVFV